MRDKRVFTKSAKATCALAFLMVLLWGGALVFVPTRPDIWLSAALFLSLIGVAWFDFDHFRIPNWISYPLIAAGLVLAFLRPDARLELHALGAFFGYGFIWGLNAYWLRRFGKQGIGMGDAKLFAAAGAWLGVLALPLVTLGASGSALCVIALTKLSQPKASIGDARIAFGPYIALGFWAVWLVGPATGFV